MCVVYNHFGIEQQDQIGPSRLLVGHDRDRHRTSRRFCARALDSDTEIYRESIVYDFRAVRTRVHFVKRTTVERRQFEAHRESDELIDCFCIARATACNLLPGFEQNEDQLCTCDLLDDGR